MMHVAYIVQNLTEIYLVNNLVIITMKLTLLYRYCTVIVIYSICYTVRERLILFCILKLNTYFSYFMLVQLSRKCAWLCMVDIVQTSMRK